MNERENSENNIFKTGMKAAMVGAGIYFIASAVFVLIFWFTALPESFMTFAGAICLGLGCAVAGIKMGSGIGKRGILVGLAAALVLSFIIWAAVNLLFGGKFFSDSSAIKLGAAAVCGAFGGMIGVNIGR